MSKPKVNLAKIATGAQVLHATDGNHSHVVGVKALRVLLCKDGGGWFAQGLEIDYASCGDTLDEAKSNFEAGLTATIHEHLRVFGNVRSLLKVAPQEAWDEYVKAPPESLKQAFTTIQLHDLAAEVDDAAFPFAGIEFISRKQESEAVCA